MTLIEKGTKIVPKLTLKIWILSFSIILEESFKLEIKL